ncbi:MAG TPA: reverse transcriptase-like protein [Candidatus Acidoferrales bacterium]|nr:reverse transcriptase-like protein [Candidatus Acidoferrales bacterium]
MPRSRQPASHLFDDSHAASPADCITATIDGAARGNPGPASYGIVFEDAKGKTLAHLNGRLGKATNNVAEYKALLAALKYAREQGWRALRVRTDSELLANQVRGRFKVKNADLRLLHQQAHALISTFDYFSVEAVPRRQTRTADKLANAALDGKRTSGVAPLSRVTRGGTRDAAKPRTIHAVYESGVLKPLEPLDLPDGAEVELSIHPPRKH